MKFLVTGATGFVGGAVAQKLIEEGQGQVCAAVRIASDILPSRVRQVCVGDLCSKTDYMEALRGADIVIHAAARVHIMNDDVADPLATFRKVNVEGTLNLAQQAARAGVRRFVFVSSIKVNGESTQAGEAFQPDDDVVTQDAYGLSKWEAEQGLFQVSQKTEMEVVIIRPPLVYGEGVKANFSKMMQWVGKALPLPFGAVYNKRSLVALDNLVSFIVLCAEHPKAAGETFLISDGEDVSTTVLLQKVARAMDKKVMLIPVPVDLMTFVAKLVGKGEVANRLFGSLQVDSSKARKLLGWKPVTTMEQQLKKIAEVGW